jgi:flagellar biosynthesis protein FliQ
MPKQFLIVGDILAIAIVTFVGFATHGEADLSFLPRMLAAFLPLTLAWFLLAPRLGLFHKEIVSDSRQIWRPAFAMIFAAPFAAILRGLTLDAPVVPIFAVVLSLTSAIGMMVWRGLFILMSWNRRR